MPEGLYFIFKINGNFHILRFGCLSAHPCPFTSIPGPRLVLQSLGAWVTAPGQMLQEPLSLCDLQADASEELSDSISGPVEPGQDQALPGASRPGLGRAGLCRASPASASV